MPRKLRLEFPGAIYHVMSRGDRREAIFQDDEDRALFLDTLAETCGKTGWQTLAWCLMPNHFHLVVETPQPNLVAGMKWLLGVYTARFNRRHKAAGHLFSGRYKSLLVEGSHGYLKTVCDYVHLNPSRAGILREGEPLSRFRWSSFSGYLAPPETRPPWLKVNRLLGEWGIFRDTPKGRVHFEREMEQRRKAGEPEEYKSIRKGWCFGGESFRLERLREMSGKAGRGHYGEERRESDGAKAERIVLEELGRLGWKESDLALKKKGDPAKVGAAARLRRETTMSLDWIAARLQMGSGMYVSSLVAKRVRSLSLNSDAQANPSKINQTGRQSS